MDAHSFRRRLREMALKAFPINGNDEPTQAKMMARLMGLWQATVARYPEEAYGLSAIQFRMLVDLQSPSEAAQFDVQQFPGWLEECKEKFLNQVAFVKIRIIPPHKRQKHWLRDEASDKAVEEKSKKMGESLFYWPVDPRLVAGWLWMCMGEFFPAFLAREPRYFYLKANRPIGASDGKPVEYICLDVDFASEEAHAYPIPKSGVGDEAYLLDMAIHGIEIRAAGDA